MRRVTNFVTGLDVYCQTNRGWQITEFKKMNKREIEHLKRRKLHFNEKLEIVTDDKQNQYLLLTINKEYRS